jgi:hypothetical protein
MRRDWGPAREKVEREGKCRACGPVTFFRLEAAHLWPRSMGGGMEPELIVPLCRICHAEFDAHQLDVLHLLTTEEQVAVVRAAGSIERARMRLLPSAYDARRLSEELQPPLLREASDEVLG